MPTNRGTSPIPTISNEKRATSPFRNRGTSPFRIRGISPFQRRDSGRQGRQRQQPSHHHHQRRSRSGSLDSTYSASSSDEDIHPHDTYHHHSRRSGKVHNVVVCHPTARSIVFRDSYRRATKIIDEEEEEEKDRKDDIDDDRSESSLLEASKAYKKAHDDVIENRRRSSEIIQQEINILASEMVPEEVDVLKSLRGSEFSERSMEIEGQDYLHLKPLEPLEKNLNDDFLPLLESEVGETASRDWTMGERRILKLLQEQKACVKTIKNSEWHVFLDRFLRNETTLNSTSTTSWSSVGASFLYRKNSMHHDDIEPDQEDGYPLNSFVTSTSLLPPLGKKMKSYGSLHAYQCGVIFALPSSFQNETEDEAVKRTETWAWPAGYAAKTEHNIDHKTGKLINGRAEALVSLETIRQQNRDYLEKQDHFIGGQLVKGGFTVIPYNEVFLRVGGTSQKLLNGDENICRPRSFDKGCGVFVALFVRTVSIRDIMFLIRTRARIGNVLGKDFIKDMPLLYLSHKQGVRVFSKKLQNQFLKLVSTHVNPFQNPTLESQIKFDGSSESCLQQKVEELIELDEDLGEVLSLEACSRIAGGYGCSDDSVYNVLKKAKMQDKLQHAVKEGLAFAVRSSDYFTARQLLVMYSLVSSDLCPVSGDKEEQDDCELMLRQIHESAALFSDITLLSDEQKIIELNECPTPSLDVDHLRRATSAFGLLIVFGAAQILGAMRDGSARKRTEESIEAVEEWVRIGEGSLQFRLASWREQRADEQNVNIQSNSQFMAFASGKAITNRKHFAQQLRNAVSKTDFSSIHFLRAVSRVLASMHSPCLRLEILHFILGLDNRYSVEHIRRSIEIAATCLNVATASSKLRSKALSGEGTTSKMVWNPHNCIPGAKIETSRHDQGRNSQ